MTTSPNNNMAFFPLTHQAGSRTEQPPILTTMETVHMSSLDFGIIMFKNSWSNKGSSFPYCNVNSQIIYIFFFYFQTQTFPTWVACLNCGLNVVNILFSYWTYFHLHVNTMDVRLVLWMCKYSVSRSVPHPWCVAVVPTVGNDTCSFLFL